MYTHYCDQTVRNHPSPDEVVLRPALKGPFPTCRHITFDVYRSKRLIYKTVYLGFFFIRWYSTHWKAVKTSTNVFPVLRKNSTTFITPKNSVLRFICAHLQNTRNTCFSWFLSINCTITAVYNNGSNIYPFCTLAFLPYITFIL